MTCRVYQMPDAVYDSNFYCLVDWKGSRKMNSFALLRVYWLYFIFIAFHPSLILFYFLSVCTLFSTINTTNTYNPFPIHLECQSKSKFAFCIRSLIIIPVCKLWVPKKCEPFVWLSLCSLNFGNLIAEQFISIIFSSW